jgi:hypothetical protein
VLGRPLEVYVAGYALQGTPRPLQSTRKLLQGTWVFVGSLGGVGYVGQRRRASGCVAGYAVQGTRTYHSGQVLCGIAVAGYVVQGTRTCHSGRVPCTRG